MKKHTLMATAAIIALAMTACSTDTGTADITEENTVSVTESASEETTTTTAEAVIDDEESEIIESDDTSSDDYIAKANAIFADYSEQVQQENVKMAENAGKDYDTVLKLFNEYKDEGYEAWQTAWNETCPDINPGFIWGLDNLYTIDKWGIIDLENDEHLAFVERTIISPAITGSVVTLFDVNAQSVVFELDINFNSESRADAEYIITDTDDSRVIYYLWENYRGSAGYMKYVQQADGTYISENEFSNYPEDDTEIIEARGDNLVTDMHIWGNEYDFENPIFTIPPIADGSTTVAEEFVTIAGEEYSTLLTELDLSDVSLSNEDVSALEKLTNLTKLTLYNTYIKDLTPLNNLSKLEYLDLGYNDFEEVSIAPIGTLTNLTYLSLNRVYISDISPLSDLTNLTYLDLSRNDISDLSPLSGLTNLTHLDLTTNIITDISPLGSLTNLTYLDLDTVGDGYEINDFSPLHSLTKLTELDIKGQPISESGLEALQQALPDCEVAYSESLLY